MIIDLHHITNIVDPYLLPAMRIYERAFPLYEQMTPSFWINTLLCPSKEALNFVSVVNQENDDVVGMVFYEITRPISHPPVVFLWYLCTREDVRSLGLGGQIYQSLIRQFFAEGIEAIVFEVERPDTAIQHGTEAADLAARRIRWYQRNGAKLLLNVDYLQSVDNGLPPTPMFLMIHSKESLTPEEAFRVLIEDAEMTATAAGPLALE